jgi:very-short-patch-repair endonuclease
MDGAIHDKKEIKERDKKREDDLTTLGYKICKIFE